MDFTPLKTQLAKSFLCVTISPPAAGRAAPAHGAQAAPPLFRNGGERLLRGAAGAPRLRSPEPSTPSEPRLPNLDAVFLFLIVFVCGLFVCLFSDIPRMERETQNTPPSPHGFLLQLLREEICDRWKTESWKSRCSQVHESRGCWPRSAASATHKWCPWPPPSTPLPVSWPVSARCQRRPAASLPQQPVGKEMRPGPLPGGAAVSPEARDAL